jgi:predicted homoserine dehydrogenase-like protein
MIIIDEALKKREAEGRPIKVGLIGAGFMGRGIAFQILTAVPGIRLAAVYNRHIIDAHRAYSNASAEEVREVDSTNQLEEAMKSGIYAVTENAMAVCEAEDIDVIIEATGTIEFGARITLHAIDAGKHVILMNAELDATLGPILKKYADKAGVLLSTADGDQPGVIMNLLRWVKSIGFQPVLAGNMKGLHDPYRTPETQREFAALHKQKPTMVTSFADGTKISMEMAVVANATGFKAGRRGMYGPRCNHVTEALSLFPMEQMLNGGLVDYILGAEPAPGVFVIGYNENKLQKHYMKYYKMGDGPLYVFYVPYHLCHVEAPLTVARIVHFKDVAAAPIGAPVCEVVAVAKRDLKAGEIIDGLGGFCCYGVLENAEISSSEKLLPQGIAEGSVLKKNIKKDQVLTYADIDLPQGRLCDKLRIEQDLLLTDI